jgi:hypothetical protein
MDRAEHKHKVGRDPKPYFEMADSITTNHISKAQGNLLFHKVVATKTTPDTIHHSQFYFDTRDTIVKIIHYK